MIETLAVLIVVAAAAALLLWWPRTRQRRQPSERATRPMTHASARPAAPPADNEAATRLRREMAERVQAARLAREKAGSAPPPRPAPDAPTGFAETTLLEDQHP